MTRWRPRFFPLLLLVGAAIAAPAHAQTHWAAVLTGAAETPPASTPATGTFDALLSSDGTAMSFTLTFQNLVGTPTAAHIQRGASGVSGPIVYYLSAGGFTSPLVGFTDPQPAGGATGFNPADLADLQAGNLYVNLRTTAFSGGEIRGQIVSAVAVRPQTWGRIKDLFR